MSLALQGEDGAEGRDGPASRGLVGRLGEGGSSKDMEVCDVCGALLIVGDAQQRIDEHIMGKQHVGYARIRDYMDGRDKVTHAQCAWCMRNAHGACMHNARGACMRSARGGCTGTAGGQVYRHLDVFIWCRKQSTRRSYSESRCFSSLIL